MKNDGYLTEQDNEVSKVAKVMVGVGGVNGERSKYTQSVTSI